MGYIGDKCKDLKAINISGCITLTDEGILQLTQVSKINGAPFRFGKHKHIAEKVFSRLSYLYTYPLQIKI